MQTDNLDPQTDAGNQDQGGSATAVAPAPAPAPSFSWKSNLGDDLSKAPSLGKFEDSKNGLIDVAKSYVNLEKLLGHEKIPLPKGPDDEVGRAAFNKAIGVPPSPELYNLEDAKMPQDLGSVTFDKSGFQQVMHKHGLTPAQAQGLWKDYIEMANSSYAKISKDHSDLIDKNVNALRKEWGDAYSANVEIADMVISKFSDSPEMADFLTASLSKNPAGIKFLSKIGSQFAENKVGDFQYKRFSMTPQEAQNEVAKIKNDPNHPYNSTKATEDDHNSAVDHVNRLIAISLGKKL